MPSRLVIVSVMNVRIVPMDVLERLVHMDVRVRFLTLRAIGMRMLVVCVMEMHVLVFQW